MANDSNQPYKTASNPLDLAMQNLVTAARENRPHAEDAAALLYAEILDSENIRSEKLPRYNQLKQMANAAGGLIENAIPTVTGLVNSVVNIPEKITTTIYTIPRALQNGTENLKSGKLIADMIAGVINHINRVNHPVQTVQNLSLYTYHAIKNDGANMNMDERHELAALYRLPKSARLEKLKTKEWEDFIQIATITIKPKIVIDTPAAVLTNIALQTTPEAVIEAAETKDIITSSGLQLPTPAMPETSPAKKPFFPQPKPIQNPPSVDPRELGKEWVVVVNTAMEAVHSHGVSPHQAMMAIVSTHTQKYAHLPKANITNVT